MKLIKEFLAIMEDDAAAAATAASTTSPANGTTKQPPATSPPPAPEPPKEIAKAGDFRVVLGQNEQVSILDGKGTIRLSMPMVVWKGLCRSN